MLVTPSGLPSVVLDPEIQSAAGGRPSSVVQTGDLAVVDFPGLQLSYVGRDAETYALSVSESGASQPSERLKRVAQAAFERTLLVQQPKAVGFNVVRVGTLADGDARLFLLGFVNEGVSRRLLDVGQPLNGAGLKLFYQDGIWAVTLTLEPHAKSAQQLVASANFHTDEPSREQAQQVVGQTDMLYASFVGRLAAVLDEVVRVRR
ncbi:MAG TPA: hypothetical protein VG370_01915 [Chloroflexota bacterium]|nr:hypothetical protein [Chloroflexota bacterium]